jgi:cyclopropane-fatty-acyl-phospholipid synthase
MTSLLLAPSNKENVHNQPPSRPGEPYSGILDADSALIRRLRGIGPWMRAGLLLALRIDWGTLIITLPDGRRLRFHGKAPGIEAELVIHDLSLARRLFLGGNVGLAEAYIDGMWSSPDMAALTELGCRASSLDSTLQAHPVFRGAMRILHSLRRNSKTQAKRNIAYHYDLGNAFYEQWLDPSMTYSSGLFLTPEDDLAQSQSNKYRAMVDLIDLTDDHHVLEIGCGWGGFAEFAAKHRGARVTSITISPSQAEFAKRRMFEQGLADKVEIRLQDYRDLSGHFDRVASIEMFEAVGERYWPTFFRKLSDVLKPGGKAGLQIITIDDKGFETYRRSVDFIQRYIFPGGMLPSRKVLSEQIQHAGMTITQENAFGLDYARTLDIWRQRFLAAWPEIGRLGFDDRFQRMWEYYLTYCEGGFRARYIDVIQAGLYRP